MKFVLFPLRLLWVAFVVVHDFFDWILANRVAQVLEFAFASLVLGSIAVQLTVWLMVSSFRTGLSGTLANSEWWFATALLVWMIAILLDLAVRSAWAAVLTWNRDRRMQAHRRLRRMRPTWG